MKCRWIRLSCLLFGAASVSASAYEPTTHDDLSAQAALVSILGGNSNLPSEKLNRLGFKYAISDKDHQLFKNSRGELKEVLGLIRDGARFEDDGSRSMHHFFNPANGAGAYIDPNDPRLLPIVIPYLGDVTYLAVSSFDSVTQTSPDWALGTPKGLPVYPNNFDYKSAREDFYQSIVWPVEAVRREYVGSLFESIGRIIHHIQDMAQPQHVRGDLHLQQDSWDSDCNPDSAAPWCIFYRRFRAPSNYEKWTDDVRATAPVTGYAAVYGPPASDGYDTFLEPRMFWTNGAGKGLAEYTNRNFLSAGTMSVAPPTVGISFDMLASDLCINAIPPCEVVDLDHKVTFWQNTVDDRFRPGTGSSNPYAASLSIYDWDLNRYAPGGVPIRTVNRFTFAYDHAYLLPRAVGYSAGLINYFFRGDMDIALPPEGIYAVTNSQVANCATPCFQKVKLRLRNTTPHDEIGAGALRVIAKFHRNTCFRPDLSGEFGGPKFDPLTCRSAAEYVAVSSANAVTGMGREFGSAIEFVFPSDSAIPINATDVFLQVVFRGKLGQESDAVAVTTKDIVEPNYIAVANMTDYVYDDVGNTGYHLVPYATAGSALGVSNFGVAFGTNTTPVVTIPGLGGGQHAQIAFLTDAGDLPATIFFSGTQDTSWILQPEEFKLDDVTQKFERSCKVFLARGLYREYLYWFYQRVSDHALSWKILSVGSGGRSPKSDGDGKLRMHPEAAHDCGVQTGGVYDYSSMTPFTPTSALPWTINF